MYSAHASKYKRFFFITFKLNEILEIFKVRFFDAYAADI